jgi:hypothetical protein
VCSKIFFIKKVTFLFIPKTLKRNQNVLLCSRIFKGTLPCIPRTLKQNKNVLECSRTWKQNISFSSKNFKAKPKRF